MVHGVAETQICAGDLTGGKDTCNYHILLMFYFPYVVYNT